MLPLPGRLQGFSAAFEVSPDSYRLEPTSEHVLSQFAPSKEDGEGQFHFVWPNLRINVYPGPGNVSVGPMLPAGRAVAGLPRLLLRA